MEQSGIETLLDALPFVEVWPTIPGEHLVSSGEEGEHYIKMQDSLDSEPEVNFNVSSRIPLTFLQSFSYDHRYPYQSAILHSMLVVVEGHSVVAAFEVAAAASLAFAAEDVVGGEAFAAALVDLGPA
jgi:hypothetical protein